MRRAARSTAVGIMILTASSWSAPAAAFVAQSARPGLTAAHRPCEHPPPQRPRPACAGRATWRNPYVGARCFSPRRQASTQQQQRQQAPRAAPATPTMAHGAGDRGCGTRLHRDDTRGGGNASGRRRRRAPTLLSMTGSGKEEGAAVGPGAKGGSTAKTAAKAEQGLRLFNTEGRTKQLFRPQNRKRVKFYSCGPTVYDMAHIGNFRAFLTYDLLKRWLVYQGFEVDHVCNLTDVDDKIIARMTRDGVSLKDLTDKYAQLFFDDLKALNIVPASRYPRATEHIDDIVEMVQGLMDKDLAYEINGSVYFRVSKHGKYGTLACLDTSGMEDGAGEGGGISDATEFESEKENAKDFALWKAYKPEDGEVFWETSIGKGRPGWHIECSAMARRFLGDTVDVHAGGIDLVFPHHENEVAQSEGFTGKPFCSCWVHNAFVNVDGEKMSKSKGNFLTLSGTLPTALDVRAFRYLVVSSQYRTTLGFSGKSLEGAKNTVKRLDKLRAALLEAAAESGEGKEEGEGEVTAELLEVVPRSLEGFDAGMNDDLNTPRAAASLFAIVKAGETALKRARAASGDGGIAGDQGTLQPSLPRADARYLLSALDRMDSVFGIFYEPAGYDAGKGTGGDGDGELGELPEVMAELLARRLAARESKDWATADAVRDEIKALGYAVKDVKGKDPVVSRI